MNDPSEDDAQLDTYDWICQLRIDHISDPTNLNVDVTNDGNTWESADCSDGRLFRYCSSQWTPITEIVESEEQGEEQTVNYTMTDGAFLFTSDEENVRMSAQDR